MLPKVETCSCSYGAHGRQYTFAARPSPFARPSIPPRFRASSRSRRRANALLAAMSPDQLQDMLSPMMDHLFMAYERVVMPCHNMNCGDVVHRR